MARPIKRETKPSYKRLKMKEMIELQKRREMPNLRPVFRGLKAEMISRPQIRTER